MAADAFVIVGIDVAAHGPLIFLDAENGILRAVDHAVIALKTHAATHAAVALVLGLLLGATLDTFLEITQHLVTGDFNLSALFKSLILEVALEEFVMADDLGGRAVFIIMNREVFFRCSATSIPIHLS